MAKTLQEILDPRLIPDILSRIYTKPLVIQPKYIMVKPDYDIPKQRTDEELIRILLHGSIAYANGARYMILVDRGNGKQYFYLEYCSEE